MSLVDRDLLIVPYDPARGEELVRMWRASFERAVGITDPHSLADQLVFLEKHVLPSYEVLMVLDGPDGPVVGFLAFSPEEIAQLYVHIDYQGQGIGRRLLDHAKAHASGRLRLFTFEANTGAQRFYERHGFRVLRRGFEGAWQLADIEYEWTDGQR